MKEDLRKKGVLLISPTALDGTGIGSIFLRDLISSTDHVRFESYPIGSLSKNTYLDRLSWFVQSRVGALCKTGIKQLAQLRAEVSLEAARISKFFTESGSDLIWIVAADLKSICLASELVSLKLPIRVMIWDAPEYLLSMVPLTESARDSIMCDFENTVRNSQIVAVISDNMQKAYFEKYGTRCIVVRHGLQLVERKLGPLNEVIDIVFAGSLYAKDEWNNFISALDSAHWTVAKRQIRLHFVGRFPIRGAIRPRGLMEYGSKSLPETLKLLAQFDIGYLPYWMDEPHKTAASTSFPGKLTAYAASGLVVFHHGPIWAEVTSFLNIYRFGVNCNSTRTDEIIFSLTGAINMLGTKDADMDRSAALAKVLSRNAMSKAFAEFME